MIRYFFTSEAVVPLRAEAREGAEMVSQLLFGEFGEVLEEKDGWWKVKHYGDGYTGWASCNMLMEASRDDFPNPKVAVGIVQSHDAIVENPRGDLIHLPIGAKIPSSFKDYINIGREKFKIRQGDYTFRERVIEETASLFLGAPYLWGGRSSFGIDCSGLTQMVFEMHFKGLPRDSSQQIKVGTAILFEERVSGNLAFFSKPDQTKVSHVGIVLSGNRIIHASGRVKIETLSPEGILNDKGVLTHRLIQINRYFRQEKQS
ncbi:MAG: NlpC/P60 family protein [Bacteroidia bacterium]